MRFDVVTLFPEVITQSCNFSIIKRAISEKIISINTVNPRDYTIDKHKKVDDTPYGGGAGMLLQCQPFVDAIKTIEKTQNAQTIIMSPQGETFSQNMAKEFSKKEQLIIICGHYEGFDERIKRLSGAKEVSIGDFVMTGGEFPALCVMDSIIRLLDGVLGDSESKEYDSHYDGLLEHPHYTKPREYEGETVPDILLSGNHEKIKEWRRLQQFIVTKQKRPDLFEKFLHSNLSDFDKKLLRQNNFI